MFSLETLAPKFLVPSKRIKVLYDPSEFHSYLCDRIRAARSRIFLASLYIGKSEQELINVIADALRKNDQLKVYVLLDGLRGTREAPKQCSASLLAPLAAQFPSQVRLSMYRTPKVGWLTSKILPKRIIEGVGLQHMKLYGCDDEIILSGANLSQDYFTNRQDRYISIRDKQVTNFFFKVQSTVSNLSEKLLPANNEQKFILSPPSRKQKILARNELAAMFRPAALDNARSKLRPITSEEESTTTEVYPIGQFTPLKIGNEHHVMKEIVSAASRPDYNWSLTAGYFNVEPELARGLAQASGGEIIIASPQANGFYKSKGISGQLPHFYSLLARKFLESIPSNKSVAVRDWQRGVVNTPGGWSYHAKGIWLWKNSDKGNQNGPFLTYIGSSNFTRRSYRHDLECGAILVSNNETTQTPESDNSDLLSSQLGTELEHLRKYCGAPLSLQTLIPKASLKDRLLLLLFGDRL